MAIADLYPIPATANRVKVTPEAADDWLKNRNHPKNRALSERVATKYARTMKEGRWLPTHQGLAFDEDGFLIDGQHRLRAIVLAGVPVEMFVIPGCDFETFAVLDSGHKRGAGQLLHVSHSHQVAASARVLAALSGDYKTQMREPLYVADLETYQVIEIVDQWPELVKYAAAVHRCHLTTRINRTMHLAVLAQASRTRYAPRIPSWIDGLSTGADLNATDPRLLLRNRFIKDGPLLSGTAQRRQTYGLIVRAWNAHARHRPIGNLKVREDEGVLTIAD